VHRYRTLRHIAEALWLQLTTGSAKLRSTFYPHVHTYGLQILVRVLPINGLHVRILHVAPNALCSGMSILHVSTVTFFANCSQKPASTSNLSKSPESQWNVDSNNVLSIWKYYQFFTHESNTFLCEKYVILPILTNGVQMPKIPKQPLPFGEREPPSKTWMPGLTPLTTPHGIRIHSAALPQYTFWTDRPTDTHTDRQMG